MVDQVLRLFRIKTDFDLNLMEKARLWETLRRVSWKMEEVFNKVKPDLLLCKDTTTAFAVALKAFYSRIPVAHIEARPQDF